jgi:hypothetical protein
VRALQPGQARSHEHAALEFFSSHMYTILYTNKWIVNFFTARVPNLKEIIRKDFLYDDICNRSEPPRNAMELEATSLPL